MTGKAKATKSKRRSARKMPSGPEDMLRCMLDNLTDCHVFVKDRQGRFVTTNAFHLKSLGARSLRSVIGKTDFDFFPRKLAQQYYDDEQKVIRTGRALIDRDERMVDPQGREHWLLTTKTPLRDAKGRIAGIVGISRDITARKRSEGELAEYKDRLEELVDVRVAQMKDLTRRLEREIDERQRAQKDLQAEHDRLRVIMDNLSSCHLFIKDRKSRFVMSNAYQMRLLGVNSVDSIREKTDFDFFPRELAKRYYADEQAVMRTGQPIRNREEPTLDRTGQTVWLLTTKVPLKDSSGKVTGLVGMSLDITELKKASNALTEERNLLRTMIDALPMSIYVKDLESRFVLANRRLLGRDGDPEELVGKTDFDTVPRETAQQYFDDEQALMKNGNSIFHRLYANSNECGETTFLDVFKCPLRNSRGEVIGLLGINTDVTELRKNEAALRDSQERIEVEHGRLRAIMDNIEGCYLFVKDRESRFVVVNACQLRMMGAASMADVEGKTDFDFFPRELADEYFAAEQEMMRSGQPILNHEEPCVDHAGQRRWLITTEVPLRNSSGTVIGLVGMSLDITELKKTSDALTEERNLLRTLIDALPMGIYVKDLESRYVLANKELVARVGSPKELIGKTDSVLFPGELAQRFFDEEQALLKDGNSILHRLDANRKYTGEISYMDVFKCPLRNSKGDVVGLFGINTDVTDLRKKEEALQESKRRIEEESSLLRTMIDNIPHDVYAKDSQGRFIVANACVAETMMAKTPDELIGKTDLDFYPEEEARKYQADEKEILETGAPLVGKVEPKTMKNGEVRWIVTTKLPLRNRDGRIVGIVGVGINDTQRKTEEEKRRHLEEQLRHAEKMKAIGQLAGGIAHDFNNQLAAIVGSADMIRTWPNEDGVAEHADMILTASKRAADLTGKLLAFARKGQYQSVPVNMHKIIAEVVDLLSRSIDKRIRIVTRLTDGDAVVKGDPTQLQNALLNIAINARDAMQNEGEITFTTEAVTLDEQVCRGHPHEITPGSYLLIGITDTGVGMDEETQRHIFEPFFTTKREGEGTGMGLAAVYGTVRNHHGTISFTSELGYGTRFRIWLPLIETNGVPEETKQVEVPVEGVARILVVDDEEVVRATLKAILERLGYKVALCSEGQEALSFYKKSWRDIDLVIIDMVMPQMGGLDAFLALQAVNPSVRAILSSGYSIGGDAQKILDAGVKSFVQKPFHIAALSRAIAEALKS